MMGSYLAMGYTVYSLVQYMYDIVLGEDYNYVTMQFCKNNNKLLTQNSETSTYAYLIKMIGKLLISTGANAHWHDVC